MIIEGRKAEGWRPSATRSASHTIIAIDDRPPHFPYFLLATPLLAAGPELRWLRPASSELEIDGLPWFGQNGGEFFRLPAASQEKPFGG